MGSSSSTVFESRLTLQTAPGLRHNFQARQLNKRAARLTDTVGSVIELSECPLHIGMGVLKLSKQPEVELLFKDLRAGISHMIAVTDTFLTHLTLYVIHLRAKVILTHLKPAPQLGIVDWHRTLSLTQ